jgi:glyoxylase-like metal-dependent hydrolase (beta-lactamase superfamily II)
LTILPYFDAPTGSLTYLLIDDASNHCAIIDPVLDFDQPSGKVRYTSADALLAEIDQRGLTLDWILETHVHADHLTSAHYLHEKTGAPVGIGAEIKSVRLIFNRIFNIPASEPPIDTFFNRLLQDRETIHVGELEIKVIGTPGHTPACVSYLCENAVFVGDTLFRADYGTARTDFPGGDAGTLYDSINKLLALPDDTQCYFCHDYPPTDDAPFVYVADLKAQQRDNVQFAHRTRDEFIAFRDQRDSCLAAPRLLYPSIQVNLRAGQLPNPESNGRMYVKLPLVIA